MLNLTQRRNWLSRVRPQSAAMLALAAALVIGAAATHSAQAQTFTVLYTFTGGSDGAWPYAGLIRDSAGNLYGTAAYGGSDFGSGGNGVIFKVDTAE